MGDRMIARGGWTVEAIVLDGRSCFRVSRRGVYVGRGYCYSVAELERVLAAHGLGFGDLTEDDPECELEAISPPPRTGERADHRPSPTD